MGARAWPRPTAEEVVQRLQNLLEVATTLIDSQSRAEQKRFSELRGSLATASHALHEAHPTPTKDLTRTRRPAAPLSAALLGIETSFPAAPTPGDEEVLNCVASLLETCVALMDSRTKAGQVYFAALRNGVTIAQNSVEWTRTTSLEDKVQHRKLCDQILRPIMKPHEDQWLERQLEGLGKEPVP